MPSAPSVSEPDPVSVGPVHSPMVSLGVCALWILLALVGSADVFMGPASAHRTLPTQPLHPDHFPVTGLWMFACSLVGAGTLRYGASMLRGRRFAAGWMGMFALTTYALLWRDTFAEGPVFFVDLLNSTLHALGWMGGEADAPSQLLSMNGVWVGLSFLVMAVAFLTALRDDRQSTTNHWAPVGCFVLGFIGLAWPGGLSPSPLAGPFHGHLYFLPTALAFVLIEIGRRTDGAHPPGRLQVLGLLWGALAFLFPEVRGGEVHLPVERLFDLFEAPGLGPVWGGLSLFLGLGILAGWWALLRPRRGEAEQGATDGRLECGLTWVRKHAVIAVIVSMVIDSLATESMTMELLAGTLVAGGSLWIITRLASEMCGVRRASPTLAHSAELPLAWDRWLVSLGLGLFLLFKFHTAGPSSTDENIYFYMVERFAAGEWPYVDYFFAHPPLHVVLPGLIASVVGGSLVALKLVPAVAGAVTAWSVWAIGREHMGRLPGLIAFGLVLFGAEFLKATTNMTGVNLALMWLMLGLYASLRGRGGWAGVMMGFSVCTGFYALAPVLAALLLTCVAAARVGRRQVLTFVLVAGGINLVCYAAAGDAYLDSVYRYHALKQVREGRMVPVSAAPEGTSDGAVHLVSSNDDGELVLVSLDDGRDVVHFRGIRPDLRAMALSPAGDTLAVATGNGWVVALNTRNGARIWRVRLSGHRGAAPRRLQFVGNGARLAVGAADGTLRLLDMAEGLELARVQAHGGALTALTLGTHQLATGDKDGNVALWDLETLVSWPWGATRSAGLSVARERSRVLGSVRAIAWAGRALGWVVASALDRPQLLGRAAMRPVRSFGRLGDRGTALHVDSATGRVFVGLEAGEVKAFALATGAEVSAGTPHRSAVASLVPCGDGAMASAAVDGSVALWNDGDLGHARMLPGSSPLITAGTVDWPAVPLAWAHNVGVMVASREVQKHLYYHPHLWVAFLLLPWVALLFLMSGRGVRPGLRAWIDPRLFLDQPEGRALALWWVTVALVLEFALFRELYSFYFVLLLPTLALSAGFVLGRPLQALWDAADASRARFALCCVLIGAAFSLWPAWMVEASEVFPSERIARGEAKDYRWRLSPVLAPAGEVVRDLFWQERREVGAHALGLHHFLWSKKRLYGSVDEMGAWVRSRSVSGDTVAGSSMAAPAVALASGLRISAGEVDTNSKRFAAGLLDMRTYWERVCGDGLRFFVATNRSAFRPHSLRNHRVLTRHFKAPKIFVDRQVRHGRPLRTYIYERRGDAPCHW